MAEIYTTSQQVVYNTLSRYYQWRLTRQRDRGKRCYDSSYKNVSKWLYLHIFHVWP